MRSASAGRQESRLGEQPAPIEGSQLQEVVAELPSGMGEGVALESWTGLAVATCCLPAGDSVPLGRVPIALLSTGA